MQTSAALGLVSTGSTTARSRSDLHPNQGWAPGISGQHSAAKTLDPFAFVLLH